MKKLLLICFGLFIYCSGAFAQQTLKAKTRLALKIKSNSRAVYQAHPVRSKTFNSGNDAVQKNTNGAHRLPLQNNSQKHILPVQGRSMASEAVIGSTTYDLQTNGTISNRLVNNADHTICAVWT